MDITLQQIERFIRAHEAIADQLAEISHSLDSVAGCVSGLAGKFDGREEFSTASAIMLGFECVANSMASIAEEADRRLEMAGILPKE